MKHKIVVLSSSQSYNNYNAMFLHNSYSGSQLLLIVVYFVTPIKIKIKSDMKLALEENHFGVLFKLERMKGTQALPIMHL